VWALAVALIVGVTTSVIAVVALSSASERIRELRQVEALRKKMCSPDLDRKAREPAPKPEPPPESGQGEEGGPVYKRFEGGQAIEALVDADVQNMLEPDLEKQWIALGAAVQDRKVTVVNLWATYCKPCKEEFREFKQLFGDAGWGDRVRFVPVLAGDPVSVGNALSYRDQMPPVLDFYLRDDPPRQIAKALEAVPALEFQDTLPVTLIFDCQKRLVAAHYQAVTDETFAKFKAHIDALVTDLDSERCVPPNSCGNGRCEPGRRESIVTCPQDCNALKGDGKCSLAAGETRKNSPKDCCPPDDDSPECSCGNGRCDKWETCRSCREDCGCGSGARCVGDGACCGDGKCDKGRGEDCANCPKECRCAPGEECQKGKCVSSGNALDEFK
jgi:thiol-disulfide isomerase/thioredoxin